MHLIPYVPYIKVKKLVNQVINEIFRQMTITLTLALDVPVRPMDAKGLIRDKPVKPPNNLGGPQGTGGDQELWVGRIKGAEMPRGPPI